MGKREKMIFCILGSCLLLSGCRKAVPESSVPPSLVTKIAVSYDSRGRHLNRVYTGAGKMDVILFYLYSLSPSGRAEEDPEALIGDRCRITVTLSDGKKHIYRQFGEEYLSVDNRPWQKINKDKAAVLFHLVDHMESDE